MPRRLVPYLPAIASVGIAGGMHGTGVPHSLAIVFYVIGGLAAILAFLYSRQRQEEAVAVTNIKQVNFNQSGGIAVAELTIHQAPTASARIEGPIESVVGEDGLFRTTYRIHVQNAYSLAQLHAFARGPSVQAAEMYAEGGPTFSRGYWELNNDVVGAFVGSPVGSVLGFKVTSKTQEPSLPSSSETVPAVGLVSPRARLESLGCWSRRGWRGWRVPAAGQRREP